MPRTLATVGCEQHGELPFRVTLLFGGPARTCHIFGDDVEKFLRRGLHPMLQLGRLLCDIDLIEPFTL
jgi:hypothetical protein